MYGLYRRASPGPLTARVFDTQPSLRSKGSLNQISGLRWHQFRLSRLNNFCPPGAGFRPPTPPSPHFREKISGRW